MRVTMDVEREITVESSDEADTREEGDVGSRGGQQLKRRATVPSYAETLRNFRTASKQASRSSLVALAALASHLLRT